MPSLLQAPLRLAIGALALVLALDGCVQAGPTSSRSPAASTLLPVSTRPVVYFERPPSDTWEAVDWSGASGPPLTSDRVGTPYQSPDGSRVLWSPQGDWQIVDRRGQVVSRPDFTGVIELTWADDSSGICVFNQTTPHEFALEFKPANGGSRTIETITAIAPPNVAACSPAVGRIVTTSATGYKDPRTMLQRITFHDLRVIDFTSGKVLLEQTFPVGSISTEVNSVVVSHDASLAAIGTWAATTVINLSTGRPVSRTPGANALAFSWDGTELAATAFGYRGRLLRVLTGQVVWSDPEPGRVTQGAASNPLGSDVMFLVTGGELNDLLVVAPTGTQSVVAHNVFLDQLTPCFSCSAF